MEQRVAIVAALNRVGAFTRVGVLIDELRPFVLEGRCLLRDSIWLWTGEVVFVAEDDQVEWIVDDRLAGQFVHPVLAGARDAWRSTAEGEPRRARERFSWERHPAESLSSPSLLAQFGSQSQRQGAAA